MPRLAPTDTVAAPPTIRARARQYEKATSPASSQLKRRQLHLILASTIVKERAVDDDEAAEKSLQLARQIAEQAAKLRALAEKSESLKSLANRLRRAAEGMAPKPPIK